MSGVYYIQSNVGGSKIFELDSTSSIEISDNGKATSYPLESGEDVSDHYVNANVIVSFSGVITDIKSYDRSSETTKAFLEDLTEIKRSGQPFTVFVGTNYQKIDNCVMESLSIKQNKKHGTVVRDGKHISSYLIEWSAKQLRFGSQATIAVASDVIKKTIAPEQEKAGQKQELIKVTKQVKMSSYILGRDR